MKFRTNRLKKSNEGRMFYRLNYTRYGMGETLKKLNELLSGISYEKTPKRFIKNTEAFHWKRQDVFPKTPKRFGEDVKVFFGMLPKAMTGAFFMLTAQNQEILITRSYEDFPVLEAGLEPAQPQWPRDFKSLVSTDSTIRAP